MKKNKNEFTFAHNYSDQIEVEVIKASKHKKKDQNDIVDDGLDDLIDQVFTNY